jgi:endonuclease/exonuclease/phosphatase family metal-dependent hydrolase
VNPEKHEPLFALFKKAGFDWVSANTPEQTRRISYDGRLKPRLCRLDWLFVKGLRVSNPRTWPAVDSENRALSDHELITADLELD